MRFEGAPPAGNPRPAFRNHDKRRLGLVFLQVFILMLCVAFLSAQSLVELAKKEKERREQLKGKSAKVITNDDLKNIKKTPGISVSLPPTGEEAASMSRRFSVTQEPPPALQNRYAQEPNDAGTPNPRYATEVLGETLRVENAQYAVDRPDGQYAEVAHFGMLDLALNAKNGPGEDIAVYARRASEGILPDFMVYGVLVMGDDGEWTGIGQGTGIARPEKFDLGNIPSIKKIRIIFKLPAEGDILLKNFKLYPGEYSIGIDAVEVLH